MNKQEIKKAEKILEPYTERTETVISDSGGQYITAHWIDGGQQLFCSLDQVIYYKVEKFDYMRRAASNLIEDMFEWVTGNRDAIKEAYTISETEILELLKKAHGLISSLRGDKQ